MSLITKFNNLDKYTKLSIAIIIIGIIIRFYLASIYHVSGDACWQLSNSRFIAENHKIPLFEQFGRDEPFWAPPLFHIVAAFIYNAFRSFGTGAADFAVKMLSPLLGSLTLILSFQIAKKLFNRKTAFYSLLFMAFIPLSIDYSVFSYVDGMVAFLAILSVYLALENMIFLCAIAAGLAVLTKYNGIFILPVLLYIVCLRNKKNALKNSLIILAVSLAVGSVWFIRNWAYLGNPVWPFMNNLFHGLEMGTFAKTGIGNVTAKNILSIDGAASIYLEVFGVPNGDPNSLFFFRLPYLNILIWIWLFGTLIFLIPFFAGIVRYRRLEHKGVLVIWIVSFIVLALLYILNSSWTVARFLLPAFPALALVWAHGLQKMHPNLRKILIVAITLIIAGFILASFVKISMAAKEWDFYKQDFEWAKSNTGKDDKFLTGSQCISYNIGRQTIAAETDNLEKADYIFSNQNFRLDRKAVLSPAIAKKLDENSKIYENEATGTRIYKIKN
ncbi:glycosyltransferase family 39 protein [Candidatus Woesearchaeota archaeon]|nr:glycosyltransferase family 39 protein [Candidatus Woesearchaeota archaeon]